jgi:hypothetical protein
MSIAVSAVVKPSPWLRALRYGFGALCALAASVLAAWQGARFHAAPWLAGCCALAALLAWHGARQRPNVRQIDISGLGEIRVSVQQSLGSAAQRPGCWRLLPGSTIWPALLILLLRPVGGGPVQALLILPDSVGAVAFRKLAVAARVIAGRDNKFSENNKIL